jgi:hypothetical protein
MPQKSRNRDLTRAALGAAFAAFLVMAGDGGAAYAAEDNIGMMPLPDGNSVRKLMRTLGLRGKNDEESTIDIKERPPLVVPPSRDLPPPMAPGSLAERNPAWPVDRDQARPKAENKAKTARRPVSWDKESPPPSPGDVAAGGTNQPSTARPASSVELPGQGSPPSQAAESDGLWNKFLDKALGRHKIPETAIFKGEPPRASLLDPPRGYRTPSPNEPYGLMNPDTADTLSRNRRLTGKPENENRE